MAASVQRGGLGSLYWGYAPFLFKALPYDTTELFTYSQLREHREHLPLLRDLSENSADLLLGARLHLRQPPPSCLYSLTAGMQREMQDPSPFGSVAHLCMRCSVLRR